MFLSKIWFVLVGLLAGVAMTAAFVAPRPADRRIEQLEGQRLDRAQYAAEQMLKTDAHRWIDYVAKLGRDAVLSEALDSASRGAGEPRMLNETVKSRLRALVPDLASIGLQTVAAVDARGRVVARLGERENDHGESIAGAEVIADALRGYLSDDVWGTGDRVLRLAAAPVLAKSRDRIVGAIYVGADTGKRLAELWKKNLGVDVAVLLNKQVVSSTVPEGVLSGLAELIEQRKSEIAEAQRTRAMSLPMGSERLLAVAAPFVGQAREQDAYYVLLSKKAPASDPFALLSSTAADDLKWGRFPWLPLGGGIIAILGIGLWLQRHEMEGPLARLRKDLQRLARGELTKLDDRAYPGKFGGVARDVNAAVERYTLAASTARSEGRKDLNAVLDGAITSPGAPPADMRTTPPPFTPASPVGLMGPPTSLSAPPTAFTPAVPLAPAPPPGGPSPFMAPGRAAAPGAPPPGASPFVPPPPPRPAALAGAPGATTPPPFSPPLPRPVPPAAAAVSSPPPPPRMTADVRIVTSDSAEAPSPFSREMDEDTNGQLGEEERTRTVDPVDPEEAHIREVFAEYLAARQQTGEPVTALTLEKFRTKLESNKQQLVAKYGCRTARFSVYVKDGKAAIKATPVRD